MAQVHSHNMAHNVVPFFKEIPLFLLFGAPSQNPVSTSRTKIFGGRELPGARGNGEGREKEKGRQEGSQTCPHPCLERLGPPRT